MKQSKKLLAVVLALTFLASLLTTGVFANDYENHWSAQFIEDAAEREWITPGSDGNFFPDEPINRAQTALILWRALGSPAPTINCPFKDIPADAEYRDAVTALFEMGITQGYSATKYAPNDFLTREMAFVLLARAFNLTPEDDQTYKKYADSGDISDWARAALSVMAENNYVEGIGNDVCAPKKTLTNGETAKLLITIIDGELAKQAEAAAENPPVISLKANPQTDEADSVSVSVSVSSEVEISFIGWRTGAQSDTYTGKDGFADITAAKQFTASANGWYAVCAQDINGNFSSALIEISNIKKPSSGGNSGGNSGGDNSSGGNTVPPSATYSLTIGTITGQSAYGSASTSLQDLTNIAGGTTASITASPNRGYAFVKWVSENDVNAAAVSSANPYSFSVSSNITLYPVFARSYIPDISTVTLDNGTVSETYLQYFGVLNDTWDLSWEITDGDLPDGIRLIHNALYGVPTTAGTYNFTVKAANSYGTCLEDFTIEIADYQQPIGVICNAALPSGAVNKQYTQKLMEKSDINGVWIKTVGNLPDGVTLDFNGTISGTPTVAGDFTFTVQYSGAVATTAEKEFTIRIAEENQSIDAYVLSVNSISMHYRDGNKHYVTVTTASGVPVANVDVNITVNGVTYQRATDANGVAALSINLNPGLYVVNSEYEDCVATSVILIKPTILGADIEMTLQDSTSYQVIVLDKNGDPLADETVTVNLNGIIYVRTTNEYGVASMNINFNPTVYIATATGPDGLNVSNYIVINPKPAP